LGAGLIELCLALVLGRVKSNGLHAQEILPGSNALWELEVCPATVRYHGVDSPFSAVGVEALLPDLEPLQAVGVCRRRVVYFGKIGHDGTLVRCGDRMVPIVGELGTADNMSPVRPDSVASSH